MKYGIVIILLLLYVAGALGQDSRTTITLQPGESVHIIAATPTSQPTWTPTPPPLPTPTPLPTSTPTPNPSICSGTVYYVAANGSDSNTGLDAQHPFQTPAKAQATAQPFQGVLFNGGDVFTYQWIMTAQDEGRCISSYGNGRAIFDGGGTLPWAVGEFSSDTAPPPADNITVDSLEVRHYTQMGIVLSNNAGAFDGTLQAINLTNNLIYDVGPGCSTASGPCVGYDPGGYLNALELMDSHVPTTWHLWTMSGNIVKWAGGHNCLQVHFDAGPTQVLNNIVGPGCVHGNIDIKGSGSANGHALVQSNVSGCGLSQNLCGSRQQSTCFYEENPYNTAGSWVDYNLNTCTDSPVGFQGCAGGCTKGPDCPQHLTYTNNVARSTSQWALWLGQCGGVPSTATATVSGNNWNGGKVSNSFVGQ